MGKIRLFSVIFLIINIAFSQISLNINPTKRIIVEKFSNSNKEYKSDYLLFQKTPFQLGINQYFIYNTNHPNLENHNGIYTPKGLSQMTSLLIHYSGKNIIASLEPSLKTSQEFNILLPRKNNSFEVLNDVPFGKTFNYKTQKFCNKFMQYNQILIKSCLIFNHYVKRLGKEPKIIIFNELIHMFINRLSGYRN